MNSFTRTTDMLHRAMDVSTLHYQVTANNLANSEVPNYKRVEVNFESELKRALETEKNQGEAFKMRTTNEKHIQSEGFRDYRTVEPRRVRDYLSTTKANGNNVDAETEAMNVLKIQLNYQLLTQLQTFEFSQIKSVLK